VSYASTLAPKAAESRDWIEPQDLAVRRTKIAYFFVLVFTAILYFRPQDTFSALAPVPIAAIVAVCACVGYVLARLQRGAPFVCTTELKIMLALTFFYAAGVPFAFWRTNSLMMLIGGWLKVLLIFFLLTQTMLTLERVRKLLWVIILCEFLIAAISIFQEGSVAFEGLRVEGISRGILWGNYFGIVATTTLPYVGVLLLRSRSIIKSSLLVVMFSIVMRMLVLTASRGGALCLLFSLALVWLVLLRDSFRARLMSVGLTLIILGTIAFAPGIFWERIGTIWDRSSYATTTEGGSAIESELQRKRLLRRSIKYTLEYPVFGIGLGNFPIVSGTLTGQSSQWQSTHNSYTEVSSEAGIPALLLFVGLMFVVIRNMRRIRREFEKDARSFELCLLARATLVSVYVFMLSAFFSNVSYDFYLYYLAAIGVALQAVAQRERNGSVAPGQNGFTPFRGAARYQIS